MTRLRLLPPALRRSWLPGLLAALSAALLAVAHPPAVQARRERPELKPAPPAVVDLLADPEWAEYVLLNGRVHETPEGPDVKLLRVRVRELIFRVGIVAPDGSVVHGIFKPEHREGFYRDEWRRELGFYAIARYLGAHGAVPTIERSFPRKAFERILDELDRQYPDRNYQDLLVRRPGAHQLTGSFMLWIWGMHFAFDGHRRFSEQQLVGLSETLGTEERLARSQMRQLSEMFILDFITFNNDRRGANIGCILQPDGEVRLTLIDNGDAFSGGCRTGTRFDRAFTALQAFPSEMIERLERLDDTLLATLLRDRSGRPLLKEHWLSAFQRCRKMALRHVSGLGRRGRATWFTMTEDDERFWRPHPARTATSAAETGSGEAPLPDF